MLRPTITAELKRRFVRVAVTAVCWLSAIAVGMVGVHVQAEIWSEDFNVDNDGVTYDLFGRYYVNNNNMWGTAPGTEPGRPMLVAIDTNAELTDGTLAPARRVGIFVDSRHDSTSQIGPLNADGWALLDNAVDWATAGGTSLNITYLRDPGRVQDQPVPNRFFDDEWIARLTAAGHTVTEGDPRFDPPAGQDLIVMGTTNNDLNGQDYTGVDAFNMVMNGSVNLNYASLAVPIVTGLYHGTDENLIGGQRGDDTNRTNIEIVDDTHPIANGFAAGLVEVVPAGANPNRLAFVDRAGANSLAPGAVVVGAEPERVFDPGQDFTNFEGAAYLRGGRVNNNGSPNRGEARRFDVIGGIDLSSVVGAEFRLLAGARSGFDENQDFIRIFGQDGEAGTPVLIGEFLPDAGLLVVPGTNPLITLSQEMQEVAFDIPASIATSSDLRLSIEVFNTSGGERIALDNLRIVPEPASTVLLIAGLIVAAARRRRMWQA